MIIVHSTKLITGYLFSQFTIPSFLVAAGMENNDRNAFLEFSSDLLDGHFQFRFSTIISRLRKCMIKTLFLPLNFAPPSFRIYPNRDLRVQIPKVISTLYCTFRGVSTFFTFLTIFGFLAHFLGFFDIKINQKQECIQEDKLQPDNACH